MLGLLYTLLMCIINGSIQPTLIEYFRIYMYMVCALLFLLRNYQIHHVMTRIGNRTWYPGTSDYRYRIIKIIM